MCGIMGYLHDGPSDHTRAVVREMIAHSRHRGPDGSGCIDIPLGDRTLCLGHTRLSILDLTDDSSQPMRDDTTGSWLLFNGEIYNFRELRAELKADDVRFYTSGDTEVLLQALVRWGEQALSKLQGMFAFAFWDAPHRELLLARDPLGIKPLYYHRTHHQFAFASEVNTIAKAQICDLRPDLDAVNSFLTYGAVAGPSTIYKQVCELEPGHLLRVNSHGEISDAPYSSLARNLSETQVAASDFEDAVQMIRERLDHAVQAHLVSDVPVGVFLSGGVDSSLLSLLASRHCNSPITLLTVAFPEQEFSELFYARQIARGLPHHHEVVTLTSSQLRDLLPEALSAMDQPSVDGINTFVISRAGAELGLKVLLTGIGGDELFGGYTTFRKVPLLARYGGLLRPAAKVLGGAWSANPIQWKKLADAQSPRDLTEAYLLQRSIRWNKHSRSVSSGAPQELDLLQNDFQKLAALELQFYMRNQLLRDADVFSMANSVELRVPFLDLRLLETALSLPPKYHFEAKQGKRLTRRILQDLASEPIPQRRKMGFTFPWKHWLRRELKQTISDVLHNGHLYEPFGLQPSYGRQLLQGLENQDRLQSWSEVWSLFVLLNWQLKSEVTCAVA